ncbi:hypothetical protein QUW56_05670 [Phocaeicola barnesiae]|uniref:hypothetical protein n=1 Tax=Phocaeicola barnesiae TaxID=376804 RepID=UPI0025A392D2|nr:hypothetical protein [Phocaeicola barnesiae]MDM8232877.1 hypothetical protein [Phocaeicola barnesiae]MDM8251115.1 hypothetical protein [Phocaeicola barnesiae]
MVCQQAVCLVLPPDGFHDVQQVEFLAFQQGAERVYLRRAHEVLAVGLHALQQAVGTQPLGAVVQVIAFFPAYHPLAQHGKRGDAAVGGVDVRPDFLYLHGFRLYLAHPLPFLYEDSRHGGYGCHRDGYEHGHFQV